MKRFLSLLLAILCGAALLIPTAHAKHGGRPGKPQIPGTVLNIDSHSITISVSATDTTAPPSGNYIVGPNTKIFINGHRASFANIHLGMVAQITPSPDNRMFAEKIEINGFAKRHKHKH